MDRNIHFDRMRDTSKIIIPFIKKTYSSLYSQYSFLFKTLNLYVENRTHTGQYLLRPYLVRLSYELAGGSEWETILPACAALEILNISTYQSNIAFDAKNGIITELDKSNQFISSMISLDLAVDTLCKLDGKIDDERIKDIIARIYSTNNEIYVGQYYSINVLRFSEIDSSMPNHDYLSRYRARCEKLGGSLTRLCFEIGGILAATDEVTLRNLSTIGYILGTAGQMVNDLSDYVPTNQQQSHGYYNSEPYSDIKNGVITLPIFHLLRNSSNEQKKFVLDLLNNNKFRTTKLLENKLSIMLCECGSVQTMKELVLTYYKALKKKVKELPTSNKRDLLSLAFSSLVTNKYFAYFRKYHYSEYNQYATRSSRYE